MNKQEALLKLKAKDWSSLTNEQIIKFMYEILPFMNTSVAQNILLNNPNILLGYCNNITETEKNILEKSHETVKDILSSINKTVETLNQIILNSNISFEERKYYLEIIDKKHNDMIEIYKDEQNFFLKLFGFGLLAFGAVFALLGAISSDSKPNENENKF